MSEHHHVRYSSALVSSVFDFIRTMAKSPVTDELPELRLKFQTVLWVAEKRAIPESFSVQRLADEFRLSRNGMRIHVHTNPMLWVRPPPTRTQGATVFLAPWLLDIANNQEKLS